MLFIFNLAKYLKVKSYSGGLYLKKYTDLFLFILYLSTFTFGGGFVIITFMKKKFVDEKHWLKEDEMLDLTAIAQSSPGSIAVNASILVGYKILGVPGVMISIIATILPPIIIISIISLFYDAFQSNPFIAGALKGMQAAVAAIVLDVSLQMALKIVKAKKWISTAIMILSFVLVFFLNLNIVYIILGCALFGLCKALLKRKKGSDCKEEIV